MNVTIGQEVAIMPETSWGIPVYGRVTAVTKTGQATVVATIGGHTYRFTPRGVELGSGSSLYRRRMETDVAKVRANQAFREAQTAAATALNAVKVSRTVQQWGHESMLEEAVKLQTLLDEAVKAIVQFGTATAATK